LNGYNAHVKWNRYIQRLNYKLALLGEWKPDDKAKWTRTLDAAGIFEYGFILQDRTSYSRTVTVRL